MPIIKLFWILSPIYNKFVCTSNNWNFGSKTSNGTFLPIFQNNYHPSDLFLFNVLLRQSRSILMLALACHECCEWYFPCILHVYSGFSRSDTYFLSNRFFFLCDLAEVVPECLEILEDLLEARTVCRTEHLCLSIISHHWSDPRTYLCSWALSPSTRAPTRCTEVFVISGWIN